MRLHRRSFHALPTITLLALAAVSLGLPSAARAEPDGLSAGDGLLAGDAAWSRWQGRLGVSSQPGPALSGTAGRAQRSLGQNSLQSLSVLGDYYFLQHDGNPASRYGGGFRATGGVIVGARSAPWSLLPGSLSAPGVAVGAGRHRFALAGEAPVGFDHGDDGADSVSYLGIGYTGLRGLGAGGGWGFSADLGVMALRPRSAVRLGQQGLGEVLRELQLSPLLQLGVSYSF